MYNKENFLKLVSERDPKTLAEIKWRRRNRWWIKIVKQIQLNFLIMRDKILNK